MRRLVLVVLAFALLCQGSWAALSLPCRGGDCCGGSVATLAVLPAPEPAAGMPAADGDRHPCATIAAPACDSGTCHCQGPGFAALLAQPPALPEVGPAPAVPDRSPQPVAQHVPERLLRPPAGAS